MWPSRRGWCEREGSGRYAYPFRTPPSSAEATEAPAAALGPDAGEAGGEGGPKETTGRVYVDFRGWDASGTAWQMA